MLGYKISEKLAAYDEEKLILTLLIGAARETLYCFYKRSDEGGKALAPSWYLGEIRRAVWGAQDVFGGQKVPVQEKSIPRGIQEKEKVSPFDEAQWLMPRELAVRLALQGRDAAPVLKMASQPVELYRRGLKSMELLENPRQSLGGLDGLVGPVPSHWQQLIEQGISPTALERYARCPYQYFAMTLLELHAQQRPEEISTPGPSVIGQLCHAILKSFYLRLIEDGAFTGKDSMAPESKWSTQLEELGRRAFSDYAGKNPVGYPVVWESLEEELIRMLRQVVERDLRELSSSGFRPVTLEPQWQGFLQADWPEPLADLPIFGMPDRIDYDPVQSYYRVIDYKLRMGKNESTEDRNLLQSALRGKRLQLPLYILLAQQNEIGEMRKAIPSRIHGAFFLLAPRWVNGPLVVERFPEEGWEAPHKERLQETLRFLLRGIHGGRFFIISDDHCRNCEVAAACRRNHRPSLWRAENDPAVKSHREMNEIQAAPIQRIQGKQGK